MAFGPIVAVTVTLTTFCKIDLIATLSINATRHNKHSELSAVFLRAAFYYFYYEQQYDEYHYAQRHHADCQYVKCHNAECRYSEPRFAESHYVYVMMLSVVMLTVISLQPYSQTLGQAGKACQRQTLELSQPVRKL